MNEPSQPITPDDRLDRTRRPGEVLLGPRRPQLERTVRAGLVRWSAPRGQRAVTISALVRALGETGRRASPQEVARLRRFFADSVLPADADPRRGSIVAYLADKFGEHAREWPRSATVDDYLASLRATVRYQRSGIRLYRHPTSAAWMLLVAVPCSLDHCRVLRPGPLG